jgi:GNAT superfamily N-acetyltransferase
VSVVATVRPAEARDIPELVQLNALVQAEHVAAEPDVFKPSRFDEVASWFADGLGSGSRRAWVADAGAELAGYVTVFLQERPEHPFAYACSWWEVDQLGVRPEWRRRGVARALLATVATDAEIAGIGELQLSTWSFNTGAQEAWLCLGFEPRTTRFAIEPRQLGAQSETAAQQADQKPLPRLCSSADG